MMGESFSTNLVRFLSEKSKGVLQFDVKSGTFFLVNNEENNMS